MHDFCASRRGSGHGVNRKPMGRGEADRDGFFMLTGSNFTGENI